MEHEIGGHVNSVLDLAERTDENGLPTFNITGIDKDKDEKNAQQQEKEIKNLPDKPTQEAIDAVTKMLEKKKVD